MEYYVITKIQFENGGVTHTPIGYVTSREDADAINKANTAYNTWIEANKPDLEACNITPEIYFNSNLPSYSASWTTGCIDGMGLSLIPDIQNLN